MSLEKLKDCNLSKNFQKIYMQARNSNNQKKCIIGLEKDYRINQRDSMFTEISDMETFLKYCAYPLYFNGYTKIKDEISVALLEMIKSENPIEIYQVYCYISSQCMFEITQNDVPFLTDFTRILDYMFTHQAEISKIFKTKDICINTYGFSLYDIIQNISQKNSIIKNYFSCKNE